MSDVLETVRIITDEEFGGQLLLLRRTRRFLIAEGVPPTAANMTVDESPFSLGRLNLISYRPRVFGLPRSSSPTLADWQLLEKKQNGLQCFFTTELQHRFRLQAAQQIITVTPLLLLIVMFFALGLAVFPPDFGNPTSAATWRFVSYLAWTSCLGGLGAIGFLAMNSLAIQNDATFDISSPGLVVMRIVLGALFGCIVSLPFCFPYFKDFTIWVSRGGDIDSAHGLLLLVPFVLGFSTTLVMAVLNRMVAGIETMFGIQGNTAKRSDGRAAPDAHRSSPGAYTQRDKVGSLPNHVDQNDRAEETHST
jgi:hypothetical protein